MDLLAGEDSKNATDAKDTPPSSSKKSIVTSLAKSTPPPASMTTTRQIRTSTTNAGGIAIETVVVVTEIAPAEPMPTIAHGPNNHTENPAVGVDMGFVNTTPFKIGLGISVGFISLLFLLLLIAKIRFNKDAKRRQKLELQNIRDFDEVLTGRRSAEASGI